MMAHLHMRPSEPKPSPKPVSAYCSTFSKQGGRPADELSKHHHLIALRDEKGEDEERMGFVMPGFTAPHQTQAGVDCDNGSALNHSPNLSQKGPTIMAWWL